MELQRRISQEVNDKYLGKVLPVLLDEEPGKDNILSGRTNNNKPVFVESAAGLVAGFVQVKITQAKPFSMKGIIQI
jgi:tRNA A37 methylthiotransferase MiaB